MRTKTLILTLALMMTIGAAQAQGLLGRVRNAVAPKSEQPANMTPQAVVANVPSLPTPEQWATNGGHTEAFKARLGELQGKLAEIQSAAMSASLQAASRQSQTPPPSQEQVQRNQRRQIQDAQMDYAQQQQMMAQLGITQAEMQQMAKMSQKEIEAFMRKRMEEKGIDPAQFATGGDWEAENRRDQQAMAQGQATIAAQEAQEAYMEQMQVTSGKIGEAEKSATERISALWESRKDEIGRARGEANQAEEVMRGTMTAAELQSRERRAQSLENDYRAAAYQIWHEYILASQGHLKFLMPYAQAADDAQAKMSGAGTNAAAVAEQYIQITASEPEINL